MTRLGLLLFALAASGCGGNGAIFLTIEGRGALGDLRIPDDVDALEVTVSDDAATKTWLEKRYPLDAATHRFPRTLGLEQGEATPSPVRVTVVGSRGDAAVARSTALVPIPREQVISVTVRLEVNDVGP